MDKQHIDKLLLNILNGCADEQEIIFFIRWIKHEANKVYFENLKNAWHISGIASVNISIKEEDRKQFIHFICKDKRLTKLRHTVLASVSIAAAIIAISFLVFENAKSSLPPSEILSEITERNINDMKYDEIAIISTSEDKVIKITHIAENNTNEIVYNNDSSAKIMSNTLIVPKGKRTMIVLSDSTKMWVNSDSKVIYPAVFSKGKRSLEVTGNVLFEVAKDLSRPFEVTMNGVKTTALGTQFEMNNYNENQCSISLFEGKISVENNHSCLIINPNEQVIVRTGSDKLLKQNFDASNSGLWRNNILAINNENITSIIDKLNRWHNVEIINKTNGIENLFFTGKLDDGTLEEHLKIIAENIKLKFAKEGDRMMIWNE